MKNNSLLKNYIDAISDFKKYLEYIYSDENSFGKEHRGYLINLRDYEKIKEIIDDYKININDSDNIFQINQIEFKTSQYLINMILNGNKYIFINTDLWKLICNKYKKYDSPILYKINKYYLTFNLDNIELSFSHNKNIIDKNSLDYSCSSNYSSNYEKITKILDSVFKYYDFENKILNDLKNKKNTNVRTYEYLVSKNWIDKWKKFSNYENIKTYYLQNNLDNKENIMNDFIFYLEKNNINYNEIPISIYLRYFSKKEEFESFLENDSLVLINSEFTLCFDCDFSGKFIQYNVFNNKINIYLENKEVLSFKSNDNIMSLNGIINDSNLKQLIKIFYFQKELKSYFKEKDSKNKIFLISKKVITIYKNTFNYPKIYNFLKSNSITQNLKYYNLNNYYYLFQK